MYYRLVSHQFKFKKDNNKQNSDGPSGKILRILPLIDKEVIVFQDDFWFYHLELNTIKVIHKQKLEGRAFDAIALGNNRIIVMIAEKKNIVEIDLKTKKVTEIYKTSTDSLFNPKKQASHFFQSKLYHFNESGAFYLQKNLVQDRRVVFVYFSPTDKNKDNNQTFQVRQFEAKNFLYCQLDQISSIVRFKQNPQQNGTFVFQQIDLKTSEKIEHSINCPCFVSYSTVIDLKKINEEKYLIFLNGKNSQNQFIVYNKGEKTIETLLKSKNIINRCILINKTLNLGIFSFLYGAIGNQEIIKMVSLENGKILDEVQVEVDKLAVSQDQKCLVEYNSSTKDNSQKVIKIFSVVNKNSHYLKMMENLKIDLRFGPQLMMQVISLLS